VPPFARPSSTFQARVAVVSNAIFVSRAVARQHATCRGNRSAASNSRRTMRRICVTQAISAAIFDGRGKASARVEAPRLRAGTVSASLLLRTPLREPRERADHAHEQRQDHQIHHPRDAAPAAAGREPKAQFCLRNGKTLGWGEGAGFHVCAEHIENTAVVVKEKPPDLRPSFPPTSPAVDPPSLAPLHPPAHLDLREHAGKGSIMRNVRLVLVAASLAAAPALAQPAPATPPAMQHPTGVVPNDKGPNTPNANAAYMGGGMILQGAPGAPAPATEPTPPGQTPKNMVPTP